MKETASAAHTRRLATLDTSCMRCALDRSLSCLTNGSLGCCRPSLCVSQAINGRVFATHTTMTIHDTVPTVPRRPLDPHLVAAGGHPAPRTLAKA